MWSHLEYLRLSCRSDMVESWSGVWGRTMSGFGGGGEMGGGGQRHRHARICPRCESGSILSRGMRSISSKMWTDGLPARPPACLCVFPPCPATLQTRPRLVAHALPHESRSHPPLTSHACFARAGNLAFALGESPTWQKRAGGGATAAGTGARHARSLEPPNLARWAPLATTHLTTHLPFPTDFRFGV